MEIREILEKTGGARKPDKYGTWKIISACLPYGTDTKFGVCTYLLDTEGNVIEPKWRGRGRLEMEGGSVPTDVYVWDVEELPKEFIMVETAVTSDELVGEIWACEAKHRDYRCTWVAELRLEFKGEKPEKILGAQAEPLAPPEVSLIVKKLLKKL